MEILNCADRQHVNGSTSISVIIATYHRYGELEGLIQNLYSQTVVPNEIIIVDNTKIADRIRPDYLRSTPSTNCIYVSSRIEGRVNCSRNEGLRRSTSDIVVIFDDDLELPTNCLESFLRIHSEGWDVVTGTVCEEGAPLVSDRKGTRPFWNLLQHRHGESRGHTIAVSSGFVSIRTSVIRELGYLDEAFIYNYDDYDLGFRLWKAGATIIHDPRVCATHLKSITGGSREDLTGRKRVLNKYTAKYYFLSKHFLRRAVVIEYLTDILTTITDYGIRVGKVASKVLILTLAFRAARSYSCHTTQDASSVTEAPANGFVGNFEA